MAVALAAQESESCRGRAVAERPVGAGGAVTALTSAEALPAPEAFSASTS